jgi:organic hydroperoxide reductase OsmC/OhrA
MEVFVEAKRTYKSFRYKATTTWSSARRGSLSAAAKPNVVVGSPPEFKGEPDNWAPEELLVGSLNTCMMLTFLTLAQTRRLTPVGYESEAEGLLENVAGKYQITNIEVRPRVTLKSEADLESLTGARPEEVATRFQPLRPDLIRMIWISSNPPRPPRSTSAELGSGTTLGTVSTGS